MPTKNVSSSPNIVKGINPQMQLEHNFTLTCTLSLHDYPTEQNFNAPPKLMMSCGNSERNEWGREQNNTEPCQL